MKNEPDDGSAEAVNGDRTMGFDAAAARGTAVVADDEPEIRALIGTVLVQCGFEVVTAANGQDAIEAVRRHQPLVTTLDVSMPGMDGLTAARVICEESPTHIIMVTALDDEVNLVEGFGAGADDYLVKPFNPRELRARVESVLRRQKNDTGSPRADFSRVPEHEHSPQPTLLAGDPARSEQPGPRLHEQRPTPMLPDSVPPRVDDGSGIFRHNGLELDGPRRVVLVDEVEVNLTRSEFDLLAALLASERRVRSKAEIVLALRREPYVTDYYVTNADKRTIEVHMANLRRKLGESTTDPRWIETVRGVGYRLTHR